MTARVADPTRDRLRLIKREVRSPAVSAFLKQFGVSLDKVRWIHGTGRLAIPRAGIYLIFWKAAAGRQADVQVLGIEFSLGGMRGGVAYGGRLPFRITAGDSFDRVSAKLRPRELKLEADSKTATAEDRTHRFIARFNAAGQLKAFSIIANVPLRRVPR